MAEKDERRILSLLERQPGLTHPQMRAVLGISKYRVKDAVGDLLRKRLIRVVNFEAPRQFALVAKTSSPFTTSARASRPPAAPSPKPGLRAPTAAKTRPDRLSPESAKEPRYPVPAVEALPDEVLPSAIGSWSMPKGCKQVPLREGERRVIDFYDRRLRKL